jgi:parallel beta-helix repeat protein
MYARLTNRSFAERLFKLQQEDEMAKYSRRDVLKFGGAVAIAPRPGRTVQALARSEATRSSPGRAAADIYVATNGNDAWSGKLAEPNSQKTDGPLATLGRAQSLLRESKRSQQHVQPFTVIVRGGKYFLEETLVFGPEDSGTADAPSLFAAYPGEKPIISGGRRVSGWRVHQGRILVASLPGLKGGEWKSRQLFLNGERQVRARTPKFDPQNPLYGGWAYLEAPAEKGSITAFKYKPGTFEHHWAKPTQGEVTWYQGTGQWQCTIPIKSVDKRNRTIRLLHPGYQYDEPPWYEIEFIKPDQPFFVANMLEDLTNPGEWCLDTEEGVVYFWPPNGALRPSDEVVVPALSCLIDIQGASWLRFTGFTFTETLDGDNTHHLNVEGAGAMAWQPGWRYCGDAIHMDRAEHCTIDHNHFSAVGANSIYLEGYNTRNVIRHNEVSYGGANGICLLGTRTYHPTFNIVSDNHIHHIGVFNKYVGGIFSGMSNGNRFSHNRIENIPHHAINLSNNPGGRNIVEYNWIQHACLQINDTGAINMWMERPGEPYAERDGHVIRYNYVADTYTFETAGGRMGKGGWSNGIYMDNYTSNSFVYGNIVVRCLNGMQVHAGKNNLIENNIFVNCLRNIAFVDAVSWGFPYWKDMQGFYVGNHCERNIFYQADSSKYFSTVGDVGSSGLVAHAYRGSPVYGLYQGWTERTLAYCDYNIFFQGKDAKYDLQDARKIEDEKKVTTLTQWKELGYDGDTVIADPLFEDVAADDYTLKSESPALKLGFQPIDIRAIGPRQDKDRLPDGF